MINQLYRTVVFMLSRKRTQKSYGRPKKNHSLPHNQIITSLKFNLPLVLLMLLGTFTFKVVAQNSQEVGTPSSLSLEQAIEYGLENNYQAINARRDIAMSLKQKWGTTAAGLPQIDGQVGYQYNVEIPVSPFPASFFNPNAPESAFVAQEIAAKQSVNATATLNQLIFDGSYLVALEASKAFLEFSENANSKTKLEVRKSIINAYGAVLLAEENIIVISSNVKTLEDNLNETREIFKNGFAEEEDVEQLQITLSQIQNQLNTAQRQRDIAMDMLKLGLGMPLENPLTLTDDLGALAIANLDPALETRELDLKNNVDYRIAKNFTEQRRLEYKLERSKALPKLSAFVNYGVDAFTFTNDFVFLDSGTQWYDRSTVGVSLNVPIFSSFGRGAAQDRTKLAWEQAETDFERVQEEIRLEYETALNNYQTAIDNYTTSRDNLQLAERIERKNLVKFKEGIATSFELRQAQTQLYSSQSNYLQSLYALITEKANIETIRNTPRFLPQD